MDASEPHKFAVVRRDRGGADARRRARPALRHPAPLHRTRPAWSSSTTGRARPITGVRGATVVRLRHNAGPRFRAQRRLPRRRHPAGRVRRQRRRAARRLARRAPRPLRRRAPSALVAPRVASGPAAAGADTGVARYEERHSPLDLGREPARISAGTRVSYVPAAAMIVRVAALDAIGGFDASDALRRGRRRGVAADRRRLARAATSRRSSSSTSRAVRGGRSPASARRTASRRPHWPSTHGAAVAPVRMSPWTLGVWGLAASGHAFGALGRRRGHGGRADLEAARRARRQSRCVSPAAVICSPAGRSRPRCGGRWFPIVGRRPPSDRDEPGRVAAAVARPGVARRRTGAGARRRVVRRRRLAGRPGQAQARPAAPRAGRRGRSASRRSAEPAVTLRLRVDSAGVADTRRARGASYATRGARREGQRLRLRARRARRAGRRAARRPGRRRRPADARGRHGPRARRPAGGRPAARAHAAGSRRRSVRVADRLPIASPRRRRARS